MKYANYDLLTTVYSQGPEVFIADLLICYKTIISQGHLFFSFFLSFFFFFFFFFFKEKQNKNTKVKRVSNKTAPNIHQMQNFFLFPLPELFKYIL